jgi:hypothetical protein
MEADAMITTTDARTRPSSAVVMVDSRRAVVARNEHGHRQVTEVERNADPEQLYLLRIAREAAECDRLVVMGPGTARLAFEREYVSLYHAPERLTDIPTGSANRDEALELLRILDRAEADEPGC